jgi:RND family efflux transporter MFP subunit
MSEEPIINDPESTDGSPRETRGRMKIIAAVAAAAIVILAVFGYWYSRRNSEEGQAVTAPRTVSFDNAGTNQPPPSGEQTLTLQPDQIEHMGIKIEAAGESLSAEVASVAATGVVEPNAYKETPAITLLGGVLRSVSAELGQNVVKGQAVAVVFSDDLASAQSRYLTLRSESQAARQNYDRMAKIVKIKPVSNAELDQALARLRTVEAELVENRKAYERAQRLVEIGGVSREDLEKALTKLTTSQADESEAQRRYDRAVSLAEIDPVSRSDFEAAAVKLRTAESELAAAGQRLVLYGLSPARVRSLTSPSQITSEITIAAPVSGTVTKRLVNAGEAIEANKELLRITDLGQVWVIAQVYERDLPSIRTGLGASVTTDARPGRVYRGHVTYVDPNINPETRTAQVRIELENPGRELKVGMYVNSAFGTGGVAERTVALVPTSSVQNVGSRKVVFVATDKPEVFLVKTVRLGAERDGRFPVLEGLNVGDKVVADGSFLLRAELLKREPSLQ